MAATWTLATLSGCRRTRPLDGDSESGGEGPERFTGEDEYPAFGLPLVTGLVHTKGEKPEVCEMERERYVKRPPKEVREQQVEHWERVRAEMLENVEPISKPRPKRQWCAPGEAIRESELAKQEPDGGPQ